MVLQLFVLLPFTLNLRLLTFLTSPPSPPPPPEYIPSNNATDSHHSGHGLQYAYTTGTRRPSTSPQAIGAFTLLPAALPGVSIVLAPSLIQPVPSAPSSAAQATFEQNPQIDRVKLNSPNIREWILFFYMIFSKGLQTLSLLAGLATVAAATPTPSKLKPVSSLHPQRLSTAQNTPSTQVTLHYAEAGYTQAGHYASTIEWTFNEPALVVEDDKLISSLDCRATGDFLTFASDAAYQQALDTWSLPMYLIVEPATGGWCQYNEDDDEQYSVLRLSSVTSKDADSRTIVFDSLPWHWQQATTYHQIFTGHNSKGVSIAHGKFKEKRANGDLIYTIPTDLNYDSKTKDAADKDIELYKYEKEKKKSDTSKIETLEGKAVLYCADCYVAGSAIINNVISVVVDIVGFTKKIIDFFKNLLDTLKGVRAAAETAAKQVNSASKEVQKILDTLATDYKKGALKKPVVLKAAKDINDIRVKVTKQINKTLKKFDTARKESVGAIDKMIELAQNHISKLGVVGKRDDLHVVVSGWDVYRPDNTRHSLSGETLSKREVHSVATASPRHKRQLTTRASSAYIAVKGNIKANLDFRLDLEGKVESKEFEKTVVHIPATPITLPGVFTAGPYVDLVASGKVTLEGKTSITIGGEVSWTGVDVRANWDQSKYDNKVPTPVFKKHPLGFKETEIKLTIGTYIEPRLLVGITLDLAKDKKIEGGIAIKAGLENVASLGDYSVPKPCTNGVRYDLDLAPIVASLIYAVPTTKRYTIAEFPKKNLYTECFNLSGILCKTGQTFNAKELKCDANAAPATTPARRHLEIAA
ncbi:hypothetical protein T439DRAFT_357898 [Meredithblackwellia eburnea MCA 4105]